MENMKGILTIKEEESYIEVDEIDLRLLNRKIKEDFENGKIKFKIEFFVVDNEYLDYCNDTYDYHIPEDYSGVEKYFKELKKIAKKIKVTFVLKTVLGNTEFKIEKGG